MNEYDVDQFLKLEEEVWEALRTGDVERDSRMLSEEFLGVYESGFANKKDHFSELLTGPKISEYNLSQERIIVMAKNLVLLAYLAEFKRISTNGSASEKMYVSSIWCNQNGVWENIFSQDTTATD